MRSTPRWLLAVALAVSIAACKKDDDGEGRRVVVLFTTDEHARLFAAGPEKDDFPLAQRTGSGALAGGVARRAAILDAERAAARARGAETITVSAGDFSQGTLASVAWLAASPELVLMKRMRYDAVALGNHEFDLGPVALAAAIHTAHERDALPPLVLTNVLFSTSSGDDLLESLYGTEEGKLIAPYRVVHTAHGLRIGIVASMGVGAGTSAAAAAPVKFWTGADTTQQFASVAAALQTAVDHLRGVEKVDAVILLGHGGVGATVDSRGEDEALALQVQGLDLVVSGHTHRSTPTPRIVYSGNRAIPVVQAKAFGAEVGSVELVFADEDSGYPRPYLDAARTRFIPVDDRTAPTTDEAIVGELQNVIATVEAGFAPATLAAAGVPFVPGDLGSLYYRDICQTTFDTRGIGAGESNVTNLDTDAMLATANEIAGPTAVALQNHGAIRTDLARGTSGSISFADLFRAVPNGADPVSATPGFPLVRVAISTVELRAALEGSLLQSMLDGDYFLSGAGLRVEYDISRTPFPATASPPQPFAAGWIKRMALTDAAGAETQVLYDVSQDGAIVPPPFGPGPTHFLVNPETSIQPVVTTYYVALFASAFGVTLRDPATGVPLADPYAAVIRWPADHPGTAAPPAGLGNAVKDHQSILRYAYAQCQANGGELPSRYDDAAPEGKVPRRMIDCTGGCPSP